MADDSTRVHLRFGTATLAAFLALGLVLEALHGFKAPWFLDVGHEARRTSLRLAHAHGTLFALVNLAFALSLPHLPRFEPRARLLASRALRAATVFLPVGFLAAAPFSRGGDPGVAVGLVPVGGLLALVGLLLWARASRS
jgi:hypothetical protein